MLTDAASEPQQRRLEWALVAGLAAIFGANAVGAVLEPGSYERILEASPISRGIGLQGQPWAVAAIAINDAVIAVGLVIAAVLGRARRMFALAGAWLAVAAVLKLTAHLG